MAHKLPFQNKFEQYNNGNNPGLAVMVVQHGKVVFKKGYGLGNLETGEKITSSTNFRMASVTKQFTAMAVAILEEKSEISSDDLIIRYFNDLPQSMGKIKISHLIYHLSGLPEYHCDFCSTRKDKMLVTNQDVYNFYKKSYQLEFKPGNRFEYSNGGYNLLATLVDHVSGMSFQEFVQKKIFIPAQMTNSVVIDNPTPEIKNNAISYSEWPFFEDIDYNSCNALYGEDGIYSSLDDIEGWIYSLDNNVLVSSRMKKKIFTSGVINSGDKINYCYGWGVETFYKHKMFFHGGAWLGFNIIIVNFPEKKLWIVAFTNSHAISAGIAMEEMAKHYLQMKDI